MATVANLMPWAGMALLLVFGVILSRMVIRPGVDDKGRPMPRLVPALLLMTVLAVICCWAVGGCGHLIG